MGYIILSRKQVDGDLNVELVKNKPVADLQRKKLIKQYYDVVVLDKNDYDLLSKDTFKDWVHGKGDNKLDEYEHSEYYYDTERNK